MSESIEFGPLVVQFDDTVLRPRPWTIAQASWALELAADVPDGPILELCAGVGHIGLAAAALSGRGAVLVDADETACQYARANAKTAGLRARTKVRQHELGAAVASYERFPLILADPPWVRSANTDRFPADPLRAIDGGTDGLDLARACVDLIGRHLLAGGAAVLQLGDMGQVTAIRDYLHDRQQLGLHERGVRAPAPNGVLVAFRARQ